MDNLDHGVPFSSGDLSNLPIPSNPDITIAKRPEPTDMRSFDPLNELPKRVPGATFSCDGPPYACGTCEVCQQVKLYEQVHDTADNEELSDFDILNRRLDELMQMMNGHGQVLAAHTNALNYLGQSMDWLTKMLSGVADMAARMPGMGGMMAKLLTKGGK